MRMQIVPAGNPERLYLGVQGENLTRKIGFDLSAWENDLGPGVPQLRVQRSGEETPYLVVLSRQENLAVWEIRNVDTALPGAGMAQLQYWVEDRLAKSSRMETKVDESMPESTVEIPPAQQDWVQQVGQVGAKAQQQAERSAAAARHAQEAVQSVTNSAQQASQKRDEAAGFAQAACKAAESAQKAENAALKCASQAQNTVAGFEETACHTTERLQQSLAAKGEVILQNLQSGAAAAEKGAEQDRIRAEAAAQDARWQADIAQKKAQTVQELATETKYQADLAVQAAKNSKNQQLRQLCTPFSDEGAAVHYHPVADYPLRVQTEFSVRQEGKGTPSPTNFRLMRAVSSLDLEHCGTNVLDNTRVERGSFSQETGEPVSGVSLQERTTYDMPVKEGQYMVFSNSCMHNGRIFFWDKDGKYIGNILVQAGQPILAPIHAARTRLISAAGGFSESSVNSPTENQLEFGSKQTPYRPYQGNQYTQVLPPHIYDGSFVWESGILRPKSKMFVLRVADMNDEGERPGWRNVPGLLEVIGENSQQLENLIRVSCAEGAAVEVHAGNTALYLTGTGLTQTQWKTRYPNLSVQLLVPYKEDLRPGILLTAWPLYPIDGQENSLFGTGCVQVEGLCDPIYERRCMRDAIAALGSI